jgi:phenylalanine-4-hydroxylase
VGATLDRVPAHLRRFVVEQDYTAYTAVDQAVWRFVLLQMFHRLERTAHPAYARGLIQTGMSVERIPRIAEMDACLQEFGWGAVCVDGFIPPRAFQEFQALGFLPIAADIRRLEHLAYTPAPDIIHEAAGHAPILPNAEYALFLRRIGGDGVRAFGAARDGALYEAVRELSIVKEERNADPRRVDEAERTLAELAANPGTPSEATLLARLYWWTVEYGLVGTPRDYQLYGAGLLSSLAESYFCHETRVRKRVLDRDCVAQDYDITRPQPQLFVARDFAHLGEVLEQVCEGFAFRVGGLAGLRTAQAAAELATVELDSRVQISGQVVDVVAIGDEARLIVMGGECAIGERGRIYPDHQRTRYPSGVRVALASGGQLARCSEGTDVHIELGAGMSVEGRVERLVRDGEGLRLLALERARVVRDGQRLGTGDDSPCVVVAARSVVSVAAGVADPSFWPAQDYPAITVPRPEHETAAQRGLRILYEREASTRESASPGAALAAIHDALVLDHPEEWLLRWNLLDRLSRLGVDVPRCKELAAELARLEVHFERKHPIATGLRYLGYDAPRGS